MSAMQGARWGGAKVDKKPVSPRISRGRQASQIYQTQLSTSLPAAKCLESRANSCV